ncbi:putative inorganic carbon transporter subunit DabA, partial [Acidithiobacillus sp.]|uniref:putative inorganic carbon transporter subunit DabA n=1 Tax=Acidithiobacillus sp. TaxID=1872118 RepID=UPI003D024CD3
MSAAAAESPEQVFDRIIRRIAPVWPLDSFVAVNPYWGFADQSFPEVAAYLQGTAGERVIMDRRWYADQVQSGKLSLPDILQAAESLGLSTDEEDWRDYLRETPEPAMRLPTLS